MNVLLTSFHWVNSHNLFPPDTLSLLLLCVKICNDQVNFTINYSQVVFFRLYQIAVLDIKWFFIRFSHESKSDGNVSHPTVAPVILLVFTYGE